LSFRNLSDAAHQTGEQVPQASTSKMSASR
jgi:hypothetical protein